MTGENIEGVLIKGRVGSLLTDPPVYWVECYVGLFELFRFTVYVTSQLIVLLLGAILRNPVSKGEVLLSWWLGIRGLWYLLLSLLRWFVVFLLPQSLSLAQSKQPSLQSNVP